MRGPEALALASPRLTLGATEHVQEHAVRERLRSVLRGDCTTVVQGDHDGVHGALKPQLSEAFTPRRAISPVQP